MSDQKPTTVTRRRALSASLAGLLAAGAASALPTPAVVVQAPQTLPLDREPLAAWLAEYRRQEDVLSERHNAAFEAIRARIDGSDAWKLTDDLDVVIGLLSGLERDRLFALLIAHLPGIAPALRLVYEHVSDVTIGAELDCCSEISHLPDWIA